ncbi:MAG TPA: galactose-1-phosphate uridylyltransferase [Acidimicrobiales bacterium]|nr:galactose-1-phosphate uridylyltransferase [Acidimicrobiales bacterium]
MEVGGGALTERRRDPLTGDWRTFASHRQDRTFLPADDECPLCLGSANGEIDTDDFDVLVFDNRFPSFTVAPPPPSLAGSELYDVAPALGAAEVVVYAKEHELTLADLGVERIRGIIDVWADRYAVLGARPDIEYVFVFENRGEAVGVTLQHPHGQVYGYPEIPPLPRRELDTGRAHMSQHGTCLVCDVVAQERSEASRVVAHERTFVAYVPFAPRFPYEVHITAHRHATSLLDLTDPERDDLAALLDTVVRCYDRLFGFVLPYVMSVHQAPTDDGGHLDVAHLHVELTPLHRSATKLKYLAGSEMGAGAFISDVAPEEAAQRLRDSLP